MNVGPGITLFVKAEEDHLRRTALPTTASVELANVMHC